jgi:hypothetical protein|tara:strand:- start:4207 stop:4404 length:198 start_codon:yes stop_codon:yes gene_type:complete
MIGAELIALISVGGTVLATLITTIFTSMSLSRCKNINCCWDCLVCDREVVSEEVIAREVELQHQQ